MNSTENGTPKKIMESSRQIIVWDLPIRLFHWLLVVLVIASFVTGKVGIIWMQYHMLSGYVILGLLVFRLIWGFVGGRYARFSSFIRGPRQVLKYAQIMLKRKSPKYLGHNPLGGWSVLVMLITLSVQTVTGLFANDDIFTEGPFYHLVGKAISDWLTHIHRLNHKIIILVVCVHVTAVLFYLIIKKENLIKPMFTGRKYGDEGDEEDRSSTNRPKMAVLIAGLITAAVYLLLHLEPV